MDKFEFGVNGVKVFLSNIGFGFFFDNFDMEKVIGVFIEFFIIISRYFVLLFSFGNRGVNIVRVKVVVSGNMVDMNDGIVFDVGSFFKVVLCVGIVDR